MFNPKSISVTDVKTYGASSMLAKRGKRKNDEDDDEDVVMVKRNLARSGNHIYFYDVIDTQSQMWLQTQMTAAYEEYVISNAKELAHSHSITENIYLHINSPGGSVVSALAIYDFIKNFPMICVGVVEGMAASGASIMLCACAMRQMTKTSTVLCHELRHVGFGYIHETWRNIQDQYENDKFFMERLKDIYIEETAIPPTTIDEALSHDLYWGVEKCMEYELCDFVVGAEMTDEIAKEIDARVEKRIKDNEELCDCEACTEVEEEPKAKAPEAKDIVETTVPEKEEKPEEVKEKKPRSKKAKKEEPEAKEKAEEPKQESKTDD